MGSSEITYNLDYHFDENLREVPVSRTDMLCYVKHLKSRSEQICENDEELAGTYSLIGVYSRMLGHMEDSKKYLRLAIGMNNRSGDLERLFVNELRLAYAYQWEHDYLRSNELFEKLMVQSETDREHRIYQDFVYQHHGKNLFDQGDYQSALTYFERALGIRQEKANEELIDSTEFAIRICKEKIRQGKG
ncbi:tetratricopeptide repeat protein [Edaphobacillus lindanitolerans]|uniref:Tetratricopeptide repeat-containing protein n=1 Tax=Edaphobacillus lindanitolerans TaxID=550447 RepID=A0A1U7PPB5_9BACI|nr:tetratricopeptide repeat protein [Edaphobacillus lindanitolerans]SIT81761.1 Tetratricopeptide repeat-containing protein [Edaphobacillus lindanitolerans]